MTISESIKKALFDYERVNYEIPNVVHMSELTLRDVEEEAIKDVIACRIPDVVKIYGMTVAVNNRLPRGLFVVGGVIGETEVIRV